MKRKNAKDIVRSAAIAVISALLSVAWRVKPVFAGNHLPSTGERSTLPIVILFLGLAVILFIVMMVLKRKNKN